MENASPREFTGASYSFKVQDLLFLLLRHPPLLRCLFVCLHDIPNIPWNRPMVHRYVFFHAFLLIQVKVLTNMHATSSSAGRGSCLSLWAVLGGHPHIGGHLDHPRIM